MCIRDSCIPVGEFHKERFDFLKEISKMETLISAAGQSKSLADVHPPIVTLRKNNEQVTNQVADTGKIKLYDVVYACVSVEGKDE